MEAIILSTEEFLVNAFDKKAQLHMRNEIVLVDRNKTHSEICFGGGDTENVPDYCFVNKETWADASEKYPIINLDSEPLLAAKFQEASDALETQFESEDDFLLSHANHFMGK